MSILLEVIRLARRQSTRLLLKLIGAVRARSVAALQPRARATKPEDTVPRDMRTVQNL